MPVCAEVFKIEAWGELKRQAELWQTEVERPSLPWPMFARGDEHENVVAAVAYVIMKGIETFVHSKGSSRDSPDQRYWGGQGAEHGAVELRRLRGDE